MSRLRGTYLVDVWDKMEHENQLRIVTHLAEILATLRPLRFRRCTPWLLRVRPHFTGLFMLRGRPHLLRAFLTAYGYSQAELDAALTSRLMVYLLLHRYWDFNWIREELVADHSSLTLEELAQTIYGLR